MNTNIVARVAKRKPSKARELSSLSSLCSRPNFPDPLSESAFYGLPGDIVRLIEPHSEADPVALLVHVLTFLGNVIGRCAHLLAEARPHYGNLFVAVVGMTSRGRKGSALAQVERALRLVDEDWLLNRKTKGLSSGEGLIWTVRDPIEKSEPVWEKGTVIRYEAVVADEGVPDKRVLFVEEDMAGMLKVMDRPGNSLSPTLRSAWDTGDLNTAVKNNPARATGAHVSIIGHTTVEDLRKHLTETEMANGFANRFLWVCAQRSKVLPFGGSLGEEDIAAVARRIEKPVSLAKELGDARLSWDHGAEKLWCAVYPELSEGKPGLLGAVTSRAEAQTLRLALLYALADCSPAIRQPHLEAALALWRYCEASARFIFGDALGDPLADEIMAMLRRAGPEGMIRTEIVNAFGRHKAGTDLDRPLSLLVKNGLVRMRRVKTRGRSAERWIAISTPSARYAR